MNGLGFGTEMDVAGIEAVADALAIANVAPSVVSNVSRWILSAFRKSIKGEQHHGK